MEKRDYMEYMPISLPQEGVAGNTGAWRSHKPELDEEKCVHCQICWVYCPDGCIERETTAIDYVYCKGCGICEKECPTGAIIMVPEEGEK